MTQVGHADLEPQRSLEGSGAEVSTVWARRDSLGPAGGLSVVRCKGSHQAACKKEVLTGQGKRRRGGACCSGECGPSGGGLEGVVY